VPQFGTIPVRPRQIGQPRSTYSKLWWMVAGFRSPSPRQSAQARATRLVLAGATTASKWSSKLRKGKKSTIADTEVAADDEGPGLLPIDGSTEQPKAKAKSKMLASFRKKVLEMLNGKSVREGMAEAKQELAKVEAQCQESSALEEAHAAQAAATTKEFEETQIIMKGAIERETEAAQTYRRLSDQRAEESQREVDCRQQLLEEQRKLNILEVMALERRKMEELELKKKEASDTAEAARRKLAEHKQREKDALEATRKSLEGARHMGRAGKRTSVGGAKESPAKRQAQ